MFPSPAQSKRAQLRTRGEGLGTEAITGYDKVPCAKVLEISVIFRGARRRQCEIYIYIYIYIYKSSEKEEDPGLIVVYDVEAVHVALGHV